MTGASAEHARVLARGSVQRMVGALVDTNDDGRLIEWEQIHLDDDAVWRPTISGGAGPYGGGELLGVVHAYGRSADPEVTVEFSGRQHNVAVSPSGWWVFMAEMTAEADLPQLAVRLTG